jgi:Family of unknown function (DUF5335)
VISRKVDKAEWKPLFDFLSKQLLAGKRAEVEVAFLDLGDQIQVEWLPLIGLVYDHKDDIVEVALEGIDHIIYHPREIYLAEDAGVFTSFDIIDGSGKHQIVKLKDPLMLPAPQSQNPA